MSKVVTEFSKNTKEKVVLSLSEFKGKNYLDMRLYVAVDNGGPDIPTKKGLTLAVDLYPQFKVALAQVEAAMVKEGWLDKEDLGVGEIT